MRNSGIFLAQPLHHITNMTASFESTFKRLIPAVDFCSLRFVEESTEQLSVRQDIAEPPQTCMDRGAMISISDKSLVAA